jgi:hypothetical protein
LPWRFGNLARRPLARTAANGRRDLPAERRRDLIAEHLAAGNQPRLSRVAQDIVPVTVH